MRLSKKTQKGDVMKIEEKIEILKKSGKYNAANFVKAALESGNRKKAHRIADKNIAACGVNFTTCR